jgi:integrase
MPLTAAKEETMQPHFTLLARVPDGQGHWPLRTMKFKARRPLPIPGASSYYLRFRENGQRKILALGDDLEKAYLEYANRKITAEQISLGVLPAAPARQKTQQPFATCALAFLAELQALGRSTATLVAYRKAFEDFQQSVASSPRQDGAQHTAIEEIDRADIVNYIAWMRRHLAKFHVAGSVLGDRNATLAGRLAYLRTIFLRHDLKFPLAHKDWPKPTRKNPDCYSDEELNQMLAAASEDEKDLLTFARYTGFRDREIMHACFQDIDFKRGSINVHDKPQYAFRVKDKEERPLDVPLPGKFLARMQARRERYSKQELIFSNLSGQPDGGLLKIIKKIARRAHITGDATLHKFRRTFASAMLRRFDPCTVQKLLGHSDLKTTMRYLVARSMDTKEARLQLEEMSAALGD